MLSQGQHVTLANPGSESGAGPGVQNLLKRLDSGFRRNDGLRVEHPQVSANALNPSFFKGGTLGLSGLLELLGDLNLAPIRGAPSCER